VYVFRFIGRHTTLASTLTETDGLGDILSTGNAYSWQHQLEAWCAEQCSFSFDCSDKKIWRLKRFVGTGMK